MTEFHSQIIKIPMLLDPYFKVNINYIFKKINMKMDNFTRYEIIVFKKLIVIMAPQI